MTPAQSQAARGRLEAFINALLEASIYVLTGEEHAAYDGCTGLDATVVPLFSRGPSQRAGLCETAGLIDAAPGRPQPGHDRSAASGEP
jgi:hypothetical protein